MDSLQGEQFCPRCATDLSLSADAGEVAGSSYRCPSCGLVISAADLAEFDYLVKVEDWAASKRQWIIDIAASGGQATVVAEVPGQPGQPSVITPAHSAPTAAGCLLATGVFALFVAALAFTAFTWSSLGALGHLAVLVVGGLAAITGGVLLARRIPGTAAALSVAGVLLLVVAAGFLLDADAIWNEWVRAGVVAVASMAGVAGAYRQAHRQVGAARFTAAMFAVLLLVTTAVAPVLDRGPNPHWWVWWVAGAAMIWGAGLLVLDVLDGDALWPRGAWAWMSIAGLILATGLLALGTSDQLDQAKRLEQAPTFVPELITVASAAALLALDRLSRARWIALPFGAVMLVAFAAISIGVAGEDPPARPWEAFAAVLLTALFVAIALHLRARPEFASASGLSSSRADDDVKPASGAAFSDVAYKWIIGLAAVSAGGAVALALAPTIKRFAPGEYSNYSSDRYLADLSTKWLDAAYPWWRGALVGVAAIVLAAGAWWVIRMRRANGLSDVPAVAGIATLTLWSYLVLRDVTQWSGDGSVVLGAVALALVVGGLGLLGVLALTRARFWSLWVVSGIAAVGGQAAWRWLEADNWAAGPELNALFVAIPLFLAGMLMLILQPNVRVSTWVSTGPALVAALVFPVAAVVDDWSANWWSDQSGPGTEVTVRLVALVSVCLLLTVLGARNHWAAPFWCGLVALVVITSVQVVDAASLLPAWLSLTIVGVVLLLAGARWESVRLRGRRTRQWAGTLR